MRNYGRLRLIVEHQFYVDYVPPRWHLATFVMSHGAMPMKTFRSRLS
jgi:hypothetical protein